ncbi:hypothetical protein C8A05DRAFT_41400 [Staphylotrichum tortipilum]|uniref:Glucose receptor Git3 N-terminal domain-containing protein n=1 Tax=Staphylotrichum tortipilum TaxID=2831512 RepID=A0AAN6RXE2_9PEZI|nr:hypothetical protein C8A05DRAFT_41400 [Staphylotrichum longicolle]
MATTIGEYPLDDVSGDLSPLPAEHRRGLTGVAIFAALSFVSSTAVLLYLTWKLARWHVKNWKTRKGPMARGSPPDLALGLAERHFTGLEPKHHEYLSPKKTHPNQFLVLIYNLLLADIHQSASFLLNAVWVGRDGIQVRTATCFAQAWLVQIGDVAGSLFITAIAIHTYLAVVWKYTPPQWAVYTTVIGLWVFDYLLVIIGIGMTDNGKEAGGFFVRASAWCWINIRYEGLRLYLHYLWIFISLALTAILYTLIFFSLRKKRGSPPSPDAATEPVFPPLSPPATTTNGSQFNLYHPSAADDDDSNSNSTPPLPTHPGHTPSSSSILKPLSPILHAQFTRPPTPLPTDPNPGPHGAHHKLFLLYPLIYILCTLPLALGRIASMAGAKVPLVYFCTAGALITSNGWLDVLLWGVTRHRLLFGADGVDQQESGLETFAVPDLLRTPQGRRWGNIVWVEGGGNEKGGGVGGKKGGREDKGSWGWVKRRMGWRELGFVAGSPGVRGSVNAPQPPPPPPVQTGRRKGRGAGLSIQMDMVTTVVVEDAGPEAKGWEWGSARRGGGHGTSESVGSMGRVYDTDSVPEDGLGKPLP